MKSTMFIISILLITSLIQSCVHSDVVVFHQLPTKPINTKYSFLPLKGQYNNLEYATYCKLIHTELSKYKYEEVEAAEAEVVIVFNYGIDAGIEQLNSLPIYGQTGVSSSTTTGTINTYGNYGTYSSNTTYTPTYGVVGSTTYTSTKYGRELMLYIVDNKSVGTKDPKILYTGNVTSRGDSSQIAEIMPAMIKALFEEFPGKSGETRSVIISTQ